MKKTIEGRWEMPIVKIIKVFSWILALGAVLGGACFSVLRFAQQGIVWGVGITIGGLIAALGLRIAGVIGQILFDTQELLEITQTRIKEIQTQTDNIAKEIQTQTDNIAEAIERLSKDTDIIQHQCAQISCDSKDLNNNITQIKEFFNQISKRLDINE